jgi:hypothetical protein
MTIRTSKIALVIGLAGAFSLIASASFAAPKNTAQYPKDSYETWYGTDPSNPPVPGFALSTYKPGLCWKKTNLDREHGHYVPCSEMRKK